MEILMRTSVEGALILTCCLIIAPVITTPVEDLGLNSENAVPVSRFRYPGDDSSNGDTWTYNYPHFPIPLQEKSPEAKRRSSFFPVRGKKVPNNDFPKSVSVYIPEATNSDGRTFFPVVRRRFYDVSHDGRGDVQSFPNEPQLEAETASGAVDFARSPNWSQAEKRRSSFMPMRGRKGYLNENNLKVLKQYLSSTTRDNDQMNFPSFYDKAKKDDANFSDRDQTEKHFKFVQGDLRPLMIEEENRDTSQNPKSLSSDSVISSKRALSFVPTRGRREKSGEFVSEFIPHMIVSHTIAGWPEVFSAGQMATNLSRNYEAGGKSHPRYRRASAFLPMRGRKSDESPHWLEYNYLPQTMEQMQRFNGIENLRQRLREANEMKGLIFGEETKSIDGRRQKKSSDGGGLQSSVPQQKLRTAVVMKRPLSFFAARGKRLNGDGISIL